MGQNHALGTEDRELILDWAVYAFLVAGKLRQFLPGMGKIVSIQIT
jgi:hypothetical protein